MANVHPKNDYILLCFDFVRKSPYYPYYPIYVKIIRAHKTINERRRRGIKSLNSQIFIIVVSPCQPRKPCPTAHKNKIDNTVEI